MTRVVVIVEGETEESFVKGPLAASLWSHNVHLTPIILGVQGHRGGRTNYARLRKDVVRQLKQDRGAYCSTMIDFYGRGKGFPGSSALENLTGIQKVERIERAIKEEICEETPGLRAEIRFIPYLSLHEFEALLFSDPAAFARAVSQVHLADRFHQIRKAFPTPEDINDRPDTAPSKRVLSIYPAYRKVIDGNLASTAVGVERMSRECMHFRNWVERLRALPSLSADLLGP